MVLTVVVDDCLAIVWTAVVVHQPFVVDIDDWTGSIAILRRGSTQRVIALVRAKLPRDLVAERRNKCGLVGPTVGTCAIECQRPPSRSQSACGRCVHPLDI